VAWLCVIGAAIRRMVGSWRRLPKAKANILQPDCLRAHCKGHVPDLSGDFGSLDWPNRHTVGLENGSVGWRCVVGVMDRIRVHLNH
jgi:hypothetical protein